MKASEKEKLCIDYSIKLRNEAMKREMKEFYKGNLPLIVTPKRYIKVLLDDITLENTPIWKVLLIYMVFSILYLILVPVNFFVRLGTIVLGDKHNKKIITKIRSKYQIDYKTSQVKSFKKLWDDKGLRNWGGGYMDLSGITTEQQLDCIYNWFNTLYGRGKNDFDELCEEIKKGIRKTINDYYNENPKGHITPMTLQQLLVVEIDNRYGDY